MRPTKRSGGKQSARLGRGTRSLRPPTINSAVANVGSKAARPGNGVAAPITTQAVANNATAAADAAPASLPGSRVDLVVAIPIRAPSAISHARVNVEK